MWRDHIRRILLFSPKILLAALKQIIGLTMHRRRTIK
jgi:hypothetical protein